MANANDLLTEFKTQLQKGQIQKAYKLLLDYILSLRNHLKKQHPDWEIPTNLYHGYMDMTYFPIFPKELKAYKLKIAIVFNYDLFRFEIWLSAINKQVQKQYWEFFKQSGTDKYELVENLKGEDAVIFCAINQEVTPDNLSSLTKTIEQETATFINYIVAKISKI